MYNFIFFIIIFLNFKCSVNNEKYNSKRLSVMSYIKKSFKYKDFLRTAFLSSSQLIILELLIVYILNKKRFNSKKIKLVFGSFLVSILLFVFRMIIPSIKDEFKRIYNFKEEFKDEKLENKKNNKINEVLKIFVPGTFVRGLKDRLYHYTQHAFFGKYVLYDFFYDRFNKKNNQVGDLKNISEYKIFCDDGFIRNAFPGYIKLSKEKTLKIKDYFVFDWNKDLCIIQREKAAKIFSKKINEKINENSGIKKLIIVAHSYGGEIVIKALINLLYQDNEDFFKKVDEIVLILICSPLKNDIVDDLMFVLLNLGEKIKLISFHIEKDYVATNDPTNTNFGFLSIINPFNTNKSIAVSDMKFLNKKDKQGLRNWTGILLKGVNKKVKGQRKVLFKDKEFKKTTAHGFAAYYVFENDLIDKAIDKFDKLKNKMLFINI
jgi:hypothetical protein